MKKLFYILAVMSVLGVEACDPFVQYQEANPLMASSSTSLVLESAGECCDSVVLKANRSWSATIDKQATWLSMDITELLNLEKITTATTVTFNADENEIREERSATVVFTSVDGCEPVVLSVTQKPASSYVRFPDAVGGIVTIPAGDTQSTIKIVSNSSWTARLENVNGFNTPSLDVESGTAERKEIGITLADYSICFGHLASMTLKFTTEDGNIFSVSVVQQPVLRAKFGTFVGDSFISATAEQWPLSSPSLAQLPTTKITEGPFYAKEGNLVLNNGYIITIFSNAGIWVGNSTGLNGFGTHPVDKTICSYLLLPAIEGVRLSKVVYHAAASSTKKLSLSIRDAQRENIITGGDTKIVGTEGVSRPLFEWNLPDTEKNKVYSIHQANTGNMYLGDLILYYE